MYMNENSQPSFGKISVHGDGVGAPTPEMIERRAREIALIDERDPNDFTDSDWEQAHRELMGFRRQAHRRNSAAESKFPRTNMRLCPNHPDTAPRARALMRMMKQ